MDLFGVKSSRYNVIASFVANVFVTESATTLCNTEVPRVLVGLLKLLRIYLIEVRRISELNQRSYKLN